MGRDEVLNRIRTSLSSTSGVEEAAYFGSTARGSVDALSDIDLAVQCDDDTAARFVYRLHEVLEVVLYRSFSNDRWPAGRYWFQAANPFTRLDVSFYRRVEFHQLLAYGIGPKQPPFASIPLGASRAYVEPRRTLPNWSDLDHDFAKALWRFHESVKAAARGSEPRQPLDEAEAAVRRFGSGQLRAGVWELYERSLTHLRGSV